MAQPKSCVLAARTCCTSCRRPLPRSARWCVRASKDAGDDDRGVNWDAAWSEFKSTAKKGALRSPRAHLPQVGVTAGKWCAGDAGIPETESRKAPSFSRRPRRTPLQEQIRKQEDLVLDFWSSETVFKARCTVLGMFLRTSMSGTASSPCITCAGGRRVCSCFYGIHLGDSLAVVLRERARAVERGVARGVVEHMHAPRDGRAA